MTENQNGEIAILIATRARPDMLAEVFQSLRANTTRKDKTSLWLYVDRDDAVTRGAIPSLPDPGLAVHWHFDDPPSALGQTHHTLWTASGRNARVYMVSVDDARFDTPGWDEVVRKKFDEFPDGVLLAFPHDPMTADTATYPIFGGNWLKTLEHIFPGYFPFWFDDRWVGQVGALAGRWVKLPILLYPIRGKGRTKRMRNLPFWTRFFQLTLDERKEAARKLIAAMHPGDEARRASALEALEKTATELAREAQTFSDAYCIFQEERHSELSPDERLAFDPRYFKTEAAAVAVLLARAGELVKQKQHADAMACLDAVQLSDLKVRQVNTLMVDCLRATGRGTEADRLAAETATAWPQMNSLRRAFRFLGMVANDGKRMLVGLTSKGKKG